MMGRLRRVTVYETASRFYLVGCDASGTKFNVLKIDRVDSRVLLTGEPGEIYTREEILELLATISEGNSVVHRSSNGKKPNGIGLIERVSNAFGIFGVVRFLEGYYLIVITKANVVASFGYHSVYKIAEVAMISLTMDGVSTSSEEQRYVRLFQSVDLSTDFYFSYTYDLSRTLQENALSTDFEKNSTRHLNTDKKFIWNSFLLEPLRNNIVSEKWFVEVVHGYVNQQLLELPCSKISITLIGRRSAEYAGTRFLKRGANLRGHVANDVETEQIVWDTASPASLAKGRFTAFTQRRGSVPLRWSQDPATRGVVGKPLILIDIHEPHAQTAGAHFRELRKKYGNPIVVMNLVKRREKRRHENLLHEQFLKAVNYLNQFVPPEEQICYLSFDVARCNKASTVTSNVLTKMEEIAMNAVQKHGWFQTFPMPYAHSVCLRSALADMVPSSSADGRFLLQRGVSRTNCVDCLDRTNVAQFAIGKVALGCQLFAMGVLDEPHLSLQSEVCRVYEEMLDQHGDTMAWQYAGSQLVHSIKTYKKTAAFQERSRDVLQTLSRYYSNTFADYDKQAAINLFLGVFRPQISSTIPLWDLPSDYYLHFPTTMTVSTDYCAWMYDEEEIDDMVRLAIGENAEKEDEKKHDGRQLSRVTLTSDDDFRDFYRTFEMTTLESKVKTQVALDQRALTVNGVNQEVSNTGQFLKLWKADPKEKDNKGKKQSRDSDDDEDDVEEEKTGVDDVLEAEEAWLRLVKKEDRRSREKENLDRSGSSTKSTRPVLATGLRFAKEIYGLTKTGPSTRDRELYQQYTLNGGFLVDENDWKRLKPKRLTDQKVPSPSKSDVRNAFFTTDDTFQCGEPELSKISYSFYNRSCDVQQHAISKTDLNTFNKYPAIF